jgi:serine/threonine protein kinase
MTTPREEAPPSVEPLDRSEAKTFGKFKIVGKLGRGGMGIVLDAIGPDGMPVALKLIRPTGDADKRKLFSARLHREAKILRRLKHPGVVRLVDSGCIHGILYLAMERVEGRPLGALLKRGPMDAEIVISLGISIGDTLANLHQAGVVHRDIKPDNVIIDSHGRPILTDFGLARLSGSTAITRRDELVGSLGYIAPEIIEGREPSPRSDQYALGRLLFTLAAGAPPKNPDNMPLLEQLAQSLRIDWSVFPMGGLFAELRPTIRHMIRTNPENRFPDLNACVSELERIRPRDSIFDSTTDKQPVAPRMPKHDWSAPPEPDAPKAKETWEDDTKFHPVAPSLIELESNHSPASKAPWLASDLGAPAALPNPDLSLVDPNSENGPFFAESGDLPMSLPESSRPVTEDDVASATDTRDLIVKMRRRTQVVWSASEGPGAEDASEHRSRAKAFWGSRAIDSPPNANASGENPSLDIPIGDAEEALAQWSHIVDDLIHPPPNDLEHAVTVPDPPILAPAPPSPSIPSPPAFPRVTGPRSQPSILPTAPSSSALAAMSSSPPHPDQEAALVAEKSAAEPSPTSSPALSIMPARAPDPLWANAPVPADVPGQTFRRVPGGKAAVGEGPIRGAASEPSTPKAMQFGPLAYVLIGVFIGVTVTAIVFYVFLSRRPELSSLITPP